MIVWLMQRRHVQGMCVQCVFRVSSRNVCLSHRHIAVPAVPVVCAGWATLPLWAPALERSCHGHQACLGRERSSDLRVPPPWGDPYFSLQSTLTATAVQLSAVTVECLLGGTWSSVKYLLILNGEVIKWTEQLNLCRISYFLWQMLGVFSWEGRTLSLLQMPSIFNNQNSLGKKSGVAIPNCGYCYIALFTVNLAQYW